MTEVSLKFWFKPLKYSLWHALASYAEVKGNKPKARKHYKLDTVGLYREVYVCSSAHVQQRVGILRGKVINCPG